MERTEEMNREVSVVYEYVGSEKPLVRFVELCVLIVFLILMCILLIPIFIINVFIYIYNAIVCGFFRIMDVFSK
jgi:hypothetical protein